MWRPEPTRFGAAPGSRMTATVFGGTVKSYVTVSPSRFQDETISPFGPFTDARAQERAAIGCGARTTSPKAGFFAHVTALVESFVSAGRMPARYW